MKKNFLQSLAARLSLWILPLAGLVFIVVLTTNHFLSHTALEDHIEELTRATATSTTTKIETVFDSAEMSTNSLAAIISGSNITEKQVHQTIKAFLDSNSNVFGMSVFKDQDEMDEYLAAMQDKVKEGE